MYTPSRYPDTASRRSAKRQGQRSVLAIGGFVGIALSCFSTVLLAQSTVGETGNENNANAAAIESPHVWNNLISPPQLVDPIEIRITAATPTKFVPDFDRVGCEGQIYEFFLPDSKDAIVTMDPEMGALRYPLWLTGGRNVSVVGLEFRTEVQPGCGVGQAHQVRDRANLNIHPRLVGGKVMRLRQTGTTYLEGIDIDLMGQEADCFVVRNKRKMSPARIKAERHILIVNSRCTGIEGLSRSPIGDGLHGDFFQNQGKDDIGSLVLENVTYKSSSNGITLHQWNGKRRRPGLLKLLNVDYAWDERYSADSRYEISGLMFTGSADNIELDNVWMNDGRGERFNYGFINGKRVGAYHKNGYIAKHEGLLNGVPPLGEFAPIDQTGLEYVSPHARFSATVE